MRPPSTELLRALRLATLPLSLPLPPSVSRQPLCLASRHISCYPSPSQRGLNTSSRLLAASETSGRPVSSPRRTRTNVNSTTRPTTTNTTTTSDMTSRTGAPARTPSPTISNAQAQAQAQSQTQTQAQARAKSQSHPYPINTRAPKNHDRGPASDEDTQTDFAKMDILTNAGATTPATAIDACIDDGFYLNNGVQTRGGLGVLLIDGEAFVWAPWNVNAKAKANTTTTRNTGTTTGTAGADKSESAPGQGSTAGFSQYLDRRGVLTLPPSALGIFELIYPKPDLLIIGTGRKLWMLGQDTRKYLSEQLGIRVDVMDTANAAAAYNLLATERGVTEVAGLMIPDGFVGW